MLDGRGGWDFMYNTLWLCGMLFGIDLCDDLFVLVVVV